MATAPRQCKTPSCKNTAHRQSTTGLCRPCFEAHASATRRRTPRLCVGCKKPLYRGTKGDTCAACLGTKPVADKAALDDRLVAEFSAYLAKHPRKPVLRPVVRKGTTASPHEMVLLFSDTHYPEVVRPEEALGIAYDSDICVRRVEHIRNTVIRYKDLRSTAYPVRKLTVACLGDMLSGNIHEELEIANQFPISEAVVRFAHVLDEMFRGFAEQFPEVEVIFVPGNHPRLTKKPRFKKKYDNFDTVLGHLVAALAQGNYTVQCPKDMVYLHQIHKGAFRMAMSHGDGVKSNSFAGLPFYGFAQRRNALQSLFRHVGQQPVDYLAFGHFHTPAVLSGTDCTILLNGAVKGGDEYSIGTRYASNDPVQLLLTFHETHGLTDVSQINLRSIM